MIKSKTLASTKYCTVEGCIRPIKGRGYCNSHLARIHKGNPVGGPIKVKKESCSVKGCENPHSAKDLCLPHYGRYHRTGSMADIEKPFKVKAKNGTGWKSNGYVYMSKGGRKKLAHRIIMEAALGRSLHGHESVHHKNGQRDDNRLKRGHETCGCPSTCCNLELWSKKQPNGQRIPDKIAYAIEIIRLYDPKILTKTNRRISSRSKKSKTSRNSRNKKNHSTAKYR